ncbi:hypothetical protein GB931_01475 [Modestobacter sp. I12A-02628]|uniref:Uncharacterized protein n=1 Tax=Goekera deserti TaxID=2497753 RepID=A0A7K3WGN3_9ACTN|nr:hypothetical protein [Goekera deserti]MPQ96612.1 hypothetical protein [Goekera deserti]NDI47076.1 hypothetical protein [Goekera deserti]NEL55526.1 hypothetical protein [Goekera deserti]
MTITPEELDEELTLVSAATRFDYLRRRNEAATPVPDAPSSDDFWSAFPDVTFDEDEALELLALGEVIARKAADGRQVAVEAALQAGASWDDVATALDLPVVEVMTEHGEWLSGQELAAAELVPSEDAAEETAPAAGTAEGTAA